MSNKIAFIALTYNSFQKEDLMLKFFDKKCVDRYNLYIHPKYEYTATSAFRSNHIPYQLRIRNTQWGYFSLVEATLQLLKVALQNKENEKFILISDSHLPLYDINTTCDLLWKHSEVSSYNVYDTDKLAMHRFYKMFELNKTRAVIIPICVKTAVHASQWFVCTRDAAQAYIAAYEQYSHLFDKSNMTLADECWFATMSNHCNIPWQNRSFCFSDWKWETEPYMINRGCKKNPHTFGELSHNDIDKYRSDGNVFIRKIHTSTQIDEEYLLMT